VLRVSDSRLYKASPFGEIIRPHGFRIPSVPFFDRTRLTSSFSFLGAMQTAFSVVLKLPLQSENLPFSGFSTDDKEMSDIMCLQIVNLVQIMCDEQCVRIVNKKCEENVETSESLE